MNWEIDLSQGIANLGKIEKAVWRGLVQGKTTRQIGHELGMDFRRIAELRRKIIRVIAAYLDRKHRLSGWEHANESRDAGRRERGGT
jgi:hypothetical protein